VGTDDILTADAVPERACLGPWSRPVDRGGITLPLCRRRHWSALTQNMTDPRPGPLALDLLKRAVLNVIEALKAATRGALATARDNRRDGRTASFTGANCKPRSATLMAATASRSKYCPVSGGSGSDGASFRGRSQRISPHGRRRQKAGDEAGGEFAAGLDGAKRLPREVSIRQIARRQRSDPIATLAMTLASTNLWLRCISRGRSTRTQISSAQSAA
jgi:hypothetical protein